MLVLEEVSVSNDLKGTKECRNKRLLGKRSNSGKDNILVVKTTGSGNSLVVQRLGLHASTAAGTGSIPGWVTKILQATCCGQKKKKTPGSVSVVKISLRRSTTRSARTQGMLMLTFFDPLDFYQLKLGIFHEYACTLSWKLPHFCSWEKHCFGKDPCCST